jgi:Abnormal spindle-like microcephaly-assoc'd, ASPM-SPD-2-Hydin/Bacterial Ig-like domain (group 2)
MRLHKMRLLFALNLMFMISCGSTTNVSANAGLSANPNSLNFGSVSVNTVSSATITLSNTGRQNISVLQATASLPEFALTGPSLPINLAAGTSATFQVTFRPDSAKTFSGSLAFTLNRTSGGMKTITVTGAGTGSTSTTSQLAVTPTAASFAVNVGSSQSQQVTVTNTGTATLSITQASVTGTGFSISGPALPINLPPGQSSSFKVTFSPPAAGTDAGSVTLASNTASSPTNVALTGIATQPTSTSVTGVTISPTNQSVQTGQTIQFTDTVQGTTSNTSVTWTASAGSITTTGLFTAPSSAGTVKVTATSNADASKSASTTVSVTSPTSSAPTGPQYYVSTTGNDANTGTSTSAPWRSIQKAMNSATTGSTVNIMAGTYQERLTMDVSGASGSYITFQPYNFSVPTGGCGGYTGVTCGGDQVILDYSYLGTNTSTTPFFLVSGKSYIRVQGLTFENFTCTGAMQQGLRIDNGSSYVEFNYNKFLNLKNVYPSRDGTAALLAIRIWSPSNNITFNGNELGTIWTNMSEALTFDGSSATNGLVQDNYIHDTDQLGATTYNGANNITFRHNKLEYISVQRNGAVWFNNPSTALYADSGYSIVMERNFINHAGVGFEALSEPGQAATHDITIRNNVVENSNSSGIVIGTWYSTTDGSSVYNIKVWNNTFYQNTPNVTIRPMVSSTVAWENNILYGSSNYANSLNWNPGTAAFDLYFGGNSGPGSNNLTSDPLFVSPSTGDFSLQSTSPAINAGDPTSSTGVVGTVDFLGNPRMVNGQIDIGAYEVH